MQVSPLRGAIIAFVTLVGLIFTVPSFVPAETRAGWPDWLQRTIVLGLDLQGGSHLLLEVNRQSIIDERIRDLRRDARNVLASPTQIGNQIATEGTTLTIQLTDPTQKEAARTALNTLQNTITNSMLAVGGVNELEFGETADGRLTITLSEQGISERLSAIVAQSMEVVRNRIDEVGTTEPLIQRQGADRLLVQVPGFDDSGRLRDLISRTARLTFHLVYPGMTAAQAEVQGLPPGTIILPSNDGGNELLYEEVALGGESLVDSQPGFDQQNNQPVVTFRFDTRGAITFAEITGANVGRRFAIVLDNQVITAPNIMSPISGGTGQIQGSFTTQTANDLSVLLRAGALPATLDVIETRSVGASLGADSIQAGITSGIVAGALVLAFMVIAYGPFGLFANVALVLNIVLIFASLSILGATLTLPGIAGVVLTIGMAVDANVLIYERMREELRAGKTLISALDAGFHRAWDTIIDSHLTQLIAAVVLYFLGSGPIQGFAVTLGLGILTSLFTAYTVTRFFISIWFRWRRPKSVRIQYFRFIPDGTKIDFMKMSRYAIIISILLTVGAIGTAVFKGFNLGIDFVGGSAIEVQHTAEGDADPARVRELLEPLGLGEVQVQSFGTPEDLLVRIQLQPGGTAEQQLALQNVTTALATDNYEVRRTEAVSGTVSGELAFNGTLAVLVALVAILLYVWFRFEWQFGLAAVTTTAHDVIMTVGLFSITGLEFNLSSIAAVLTLVGLSLNETVVISDRVRENLRKYKKMSVAEIINLSINQTIVRTSLTQFTVLLALFPLVFFGGESIRGFTIAMTFGSIFGMYSSILIGGPILIYFGLKPRSEAEEAAKDKAKTDKRSDGAVV